MKQLSFVLLFLFKSLSSLQSQPYVFRGNGHVLTEQVLHITNNRVFPAFSFNFNQAFYTVVGHVIMQGASGSEFDIVYTFLDGKLYHGNAMYTSQIAYRFDNGKIYKGDSTFELDVLYNVQGGIIYAGRQQFIGDAIFFIEGNYTPTELFAILLSLDLIS